MTLTLVPSQMLQSGGGSSTLSTISFVEIASYHPVSAPDAIETQGYYVEGDGGGALYRKVASEPSHPGKVSLTLASSTVVWYELADNRVNLRALGAKGDYATDDTTAMQNTVATAKALSRPIYIPSGSFTVTNTTILEDFSFIMTGDGVGKSLVYLKDANLPIFEIWVNAATIEQCKVSDIEFRAAFTSTSTAYDNTAVFRVAGNNATYFQWNRFENLTVNGFYRWFHVTKAAQTTSFGLESMVAWTVFSNIQIRNWTNPTIAAWQFETGSGTGNIYTNIIGTVGGLVNGVSTPGTVLQFNGTGCVVGDITIDTGHFGAQASNSALIGIAANTVYRQRISIVSMQLDAGMENYFGANGTGSVEYSNIKMLGNNVGGGAKMGGLPAIRNSQIHDQEVSEWRSGKYIRTDATGAQNHSLFTLTLAPNAAVVVEFDMTGVSGGVAAAAASCKYIVRAGAASISEILAVHAATSPASSPAISVAATPAGLVVTFTAAMTPTGSGSHIDGQIVARGGRFTLSRA